MKKKVSYQAIIFETHKIKRVGGKKAAASASRAASRRKSRRIDKRRQISGRNLGIILGVSSSAWKKEETKTKREGKGKKKEIKDYKKCNQGRKSPSNGAIG